MSRCGPPGSGSEDLPPGHLRRERFRAVRANEAPVSRLIAELLLHLADLCPTCAEELAAVVQDLASYQRSAEEHAEAVARALAAALEEVPAAAEPASGWQAAVDGYLALPQAERLAALDADPRRGRVGLALSFVERAQSLVTEATGRARELTDLALAAAGHAANEDHGEGSPARCAVVDAVAGAWAARAEADLLDERMRPAQEALLTAQLLLAAGSGDPNLVGAVAMTQALFEWKLDDTEASLALLTEAAALFASAGEPQREALAWTRKAMVLEQAGRDGEAREALAKVQEIGRGAGLADLAHTRASLLAELLAELGEDELGGAPS